MDERGYGELLDLIYESAIEPAQWSNVLTRMADAFGATGGALIQQHQESFDGAGLAVGIDPAAQESYFSYYAYRNPLMRQIPNLRERAKSWTPEIFNDEEAVPKAELMRSEFYNDFLRPCDIHSVLTIGLQLHDLDGTLINLVRPRRAEQFGAADLADLAKVHPHLIRAYQLTVKLAAIRQLAGDLVEAMDRSPYGLVLTDRDGRIRQMNHLAEQLTAGAAGLMVQGGRLRACRSDEARGLEALIGAAACADPALRSGGSMAVWSPTRHLPLSITVAPLRAHRLSIFDDSPSALVCITDLEAGVSLPEQRVIDLFGLTPAEAKVALALLEGGGPRDAAESLGISFYTARAHLVRIFEKTGTGRQSELVRLMMRMIGVDLA